MNIKTVSLLAGILLGHTALAQAAGGATTVGGGVRSVSPLAPRTGIAPVSGVNGSSSTESTAPKQINGNLPTTPTATATNQFMPNTNAVAAGTNNPIGATNFVGNNGLGTPGNVAAAVNPLTNFPVNVNSNFNGNTISQDQAVTPSDRILLTTLSQGSRASLGLAPTGGTPVHFLIQNGTVTVVGTVQSAAQSQAVLAQVQQTPGVVSVINGMNVSGPFAPAIQSPSANSLLGTPTDHAFSARDQTLLSTVQQESALQLGINSSVQMPVHFSIQNGVVGVFGQLPSVQEKQALIAAIQRTPGITRVVDNVSVTTAASTGFNNGNVGTGNALTPTSRDMNQNNFTNSSGF